MISTGELFTLLVLLGSIVGVWMRAEIKIATLAERIRGHEERRKEDKEANNDVFRDIRETLGKLFKMVSHLDREISSKADRE